MSDADLIAAYQLDLRRRGLEPTTLARNTAFLRFFIRDTGTRSLLNVDPDDIVAFLDSRPLVAKTRHNYLGYLHGFYEWARRVGYTDVDPTADIPRPKVRRGLPRPASNADLDVALSLAPPRVRAMLTLGCFAGMRAIEISRLTREDILDHDDPPVIVAHGKGSKDRIVPLHPETWLSLRLYGLPRSGPVFRLQGGRPVHNWNVSQECNRYLQQVGVDARLHRLRHWFGTHLYQTSGRDLLMVADLMGHASTATTMIYAGYDRDGAPLAVRALSTRTPHVAN